MVTVKNIITGEEIKTFKTEKDGWNKIEEIEQNNESQKGQHILKMWEK